MLKTIDNAVMRAVAALANFGAQLRNERGQDLLEYALLGGLIAAVLGGAAVTLVMTGAVEGMANGIANCIDFDTTTACP